MRSVICGYCETLLAITKAAHPVALTFNFEIGHPPNNETIDVNSKNYFHDLVKSIEQVN